MTSIFPLDQVYRFFEKCCRRAYRLALQCLGRAPRVEAGPAKGLRMDVGGTTELFLSGDYEAPVQEVMSGLVNTGSVFFDIGANIGFFSLMAARLIGPNGAVYAFEPVNENAALIRKNARLNSLGNIHIFETAMTCKTGREELLLARYAGGASLKSAGAPPDPSGSILVETSTVDDFMQSRGIRPPDLVKIDVEGAEMDVLHGMVDTLRQKRPKLIIEFDDGSETKCEEKLRSCQEFLSGFGYRFETISNSYRDGNWYVRHIVALQ